MNEIDALNFFLVMVSMAFVLGFVWVLFMSWSDL
jgi:hypothetical protein